MLGIISCEKKKLLESSRLSDRDISGEIFDYGFFSNSPGENTSFCFLQDSAKSKIIILEGQLYFDDDEMNSGSYSQKLSERLFSLYSKKGTDFLYDLKGEFILGLWDGQAKRFILARDKLGRRNIYYAIVGRSLIFSSKINHFFHYNLAKKDINWDGLNLYLTFKFVPAPQTIFKGIYKLPAAQALIWEKGDLSRKKYWQININRVKKRKFEDDVTEVERLIRKSIARRTLGATEIGSYLSGGLDTSTIVGIGVTLKDKNFHGFCVQNADDNSDIENARLVAQHCRIDCYGKNVTWHDATSYLPQVLKILEEPVAEPGGIYFYLLNQLVKDHGEVVLSGEAGDVLFGGHRFYYLLNLAYTFFPAYLKRPFNFLAQNASAPSLRSRLQALSDSRSRARSFLDIVAVFSRAERKQILAEEAGIKMRLGCEEEVLGEYFKGEEAFIEQLIKFDMENCIADMFLMRVNKMAEASSIRHTAPFLDEDLIDYIFTIPQSNIFNLINRKCILKSILARLDFPKKIIHRKKTALLIPTGAWLNQGLNDWLRELLSHKNICTQGFFKFSCIDKIFKFAEKDIRANWQLWDLAIFTLWFETFMSGDDTP